MTLLDLLQWHREQQERFEYLAVNHKTYGAQIHRDAVTRRNVKLASFHAEAATVLRNEIAKGEPK